MVNISLVPHVSYMSEKPYAVHALSILHEVACRVEPIMVNRGYKIGALSEFYPSNRVLGTVSDGRCQKYGLRLTLPRNEQKQWGDNLPPSPFVTG